MGAVQKVQTQDVTPAFEDVDIRLAVGEPVGEQAIKIECPPYIHVERVGQEDDTNSLAVYRANLHCFGCGFHVYRRYASLAFLLGEWDGRGEQDGPVVRAAVERVRKRLKDYTNENHAVPTAFEPPPVSPYDVEAFHQYMLRYKRDRMKEELMGRRGFTIETIKEFRFGYTGTHFTIPVPALDGGYSTIRYRADEAVLHPGSPDYRKYEGTWGRNAPILYPLSVLRGVDAVGELWVVEGEYDAVSVWQAGDTALTVTNGANSLHRIVEMVKDLGVVVTRWVVATDQDAAGEQAANKITGLLEGEDVVRARWEGGKDLTDFYSGGGQRQGIYFD